MKKGRLRKAIAVAGSLIRIVTIKQEKGILGNKVLKCNSENLDSAASFASTSVQASPPCQG